MKTQKSWPIGWPTHKNIAHHRRVQDSSFFTWSGRAIKKTARAISLSVSEFIERNMMVLIAIVGVLVVTAMTIER